MAKRSKPEAPYEPRRRTREVWIGLFVLLGVSAGLFLVFLMTEPAMFRGRYLVTTYVRDAGGIRDGDPVRMKGVSIGRVNGFDIDVEHDRVAVRLELERGSYRVPRDSRVELRTRSIYGEMVAVIEPGQSREELRNGDVVPGRLVRDVFSGGPDLARKAQDVVTRMQALLSDQTLSDVESSTADLSRLLRQLNALATEQRTELAALTASLRRTAAAAEDLTTGPELEAALQRTNATLARLQSAVESLDRSSSSLEVVLGRVERGEGSLGRLLRDDTLYDNFNDALRNASDLAADIRERPGRYVKVSVF